MTEDRDNISDSRSDTTNQSICLREIHSHTKIDLGEFIDEVIKR